jgi:hypothetical protein
LPTSTIPSRSTRVSRPSRDDALDRLVEITFEKEPLLRGAATADRAVEAAVGGFEREQPGHEVPHLRLVMRGEACADEVFHRGAAGVIDRQQAKAAGRGRCAGGRAGRVVEPWEIHVYPGPLMRTGPDPDRAGLSAA